MNPALILGTLLLGTFLPAAGQQLSESTCTVRTEEWALAYTGHFQVDQMDVSVTVPRITGLSSPIVVHLQITGQPSSFVSDLHLEVAGVQTPIAQGAIVSLPLVHGRRAEFAVVDTHRKLCSWTAPIVLQRSKKPVPYFDFLTGAPIHVLGEPIFAFVPGRSALVDDFRVDGLPMPVLNEQAFDRSTTRVQIADPAPTAGIRTIESPFGRVPSLFVNVKITPTRLEINPPSRRINVEVTGLEELRHPIFLEIANIYTGRTKLGKCWRTFPDHERAQVRAIEIRPSDVKRGHSKHPVP
jgi:hypothetical protein